MGAGTIIDREAEVWARLQTVVDPELDEPVTDLDFVTRADVDDENCVHIAFRLPTYWCAANFSFLMADDMRIAVQELPWVDQVTVVLGEHMYADKINAGLAQGRSFQETFGDEADGDLDGLRRLFLVKAFQRRQAALLSHLIDAGHAEGDLVDLTLGALMALPLDGAGAGWPTAISSAARLSATPVRTGWPSSTPTATRSIRRRLAPMSARCGASISTPSSTAPCVAACSMRASTWRLPSRRAPHVRSRARFTNDHLNPGNIAMPKIMLHDAEAREALGRGVAKLTKAVSGTLGPKGMNAVMDRPIGTPIVSRDGVSIAAEIELECPFENMGAQVLREVSKQTNDVAGDGTTSATVLANALVQDGLALLARGTNPVELVEGLGSGRRGDDRSSQALRENARRRQGPSRHRQHRGE